MFTAEANNPECDVQRSHGGHAVRISGRLFRFEGRTGSGAWVMKVAGESSSLILKDSHR